MAEGPPDGGLTDASLVRKGGQGSVYRSTLDGRPVAVKVIPASKASTIDAELGALRRVNGRHPHIVQALRSVMTPEGDLHLTEELAQCDMFDEMQAQTREYFSEGHKFREWMLQSAHAVAYCHRKGVAHRDIKPENFLLAEYVKRGAAGGAAAPPAPRRLIAKLCDFGSALVTEPGAPARGRSACGSTRYACPRICRLHMARSSGEEAAAVWGFTQDYDLLRHQGYDAHAADVWSFGVMVYVLASGVCPFRTACIGDGRFRSYVATEQRRVLDDAICAPSSAAWARDGARIPRWRWPRHFSPALVDMLRCCMQVRARERCTMAELLAHPWFTRPAWQPPSREHGTCVLAAEAGEPFRDFVAGLLAGEAEEGKSCEEASAAPPGGGSRPPSPGSSTSTGGAGKPRARALHDDDDAAGGTPSSVAATGGASKRSAAGGAQQADGKAAAGSGGTGGLRPLLAPSTLSGWDSGSVAGRTPALSMTSGVSGDPGRRHSAAGSGGGSGGRRRGDPGSMVGAAAGSAGGSAHSMSTANSAVALPLPLVGSSGSMTPSVPSLPSSPSVLPSSPLQRGQYSTPPPGGPSQQGEGGGGQQHPSTAPKHAPARGGHK